MLLFPHLGQSQRRLLAGVPALIEKTFPVASRFHSALPADIKELSRLLTSARGERALSYMSRPNFLSAYLRYFLPWNLYRLGRLFSGLDLPLKAGDAVTDLGCGPFTVACALWIARPDLREVPLEFRLVDSSGPALEAGKTVFDALCRSSGWDPAPWKTAAIKSPIENYSPRGRPSALVCAANVFNETGGKIPHRDFAAQKRKAASAARLLCGARGAASGGGLILAAEPGVPNCGQFISLLREELLARGFFPSAPCPHARLCPMPGGFSQGAAQKRGGKTGKNRWCHFVFDTEGAPQDLRRLSAQAGLVKERAALSFLLAGPQRSPPAEGRFEKNSGEVRVVSEGFPLEGGLWGRYACAAAGLVLLKGEKRQIENAPCGASLPARLSASGRRDAKSGALEVYL